MGNFYFIDYSKPGYQEDIKECMTSSLSMAMAGAASFAVVAEKKGFKDTLKLKKTELIPEMDEDDEEEEGKKAEKKELLPMKYKFNNTVTYLKEQW